MANTYNLIASTTVGSGGASNIVFSSIPSTYTDLLILVSFRKTSNGGTDIGVRLNSISTNYIFTAFGGTGAGTTRSNFTGMSYFYVDGDIVPGTDFTSNIFTNARIYIQNYNNSSTKIFSAEGIGIKNSTNGYSRMTVGSNGTSDIVSSLTLVAGTGNLAQYSTASLYGIKNS